MKTFTKALMGTLAAGAVAVSSITPAAAQPRHHDDDRIGAGEVIAGALVIGGIAALAASANDRDRDRRGGGFDRIRRGGSARAAVERCVTTAERQASRFSYGGRADVTDVRDIRRTNYGYEVRGRIAVNAKGRGWRAADGNYGRGWNNDYRGWNNNLRGYDAGTFTCRVDGNRVNVDFKGIRGLR